jgi:hypothetical protein
MTTAAASGHFAAVAFDVADRRELGAPRVDHEAEPALSSALR